VQATTTPGAALAEEEAEGDVPADEDVPVEEVGEETTVENAPPKEIIAPIKEATPEEATPKTAITPAEDKRQILETCLEDLKNKWEADEEARIRAVEVARLKAGEERKLMDAANGLIDAATGSSRQGAMRAAEKGYIMTMSGSKEAQASGDLRSGRKLMTVERQEAVEVLVSGFKKMKSYERRWDTEVDAVDRSKKMNNRWMRASALDALLQLHEKNGTADEAGAALFRMTRNASRKSKLPLILPA